MGISNTMQSGAGHNSLDMEGNSDHASNKAKLASSLVYLDPARPGSKQAWIALQLRYSYRESKTDAHQLKLYGGVRKAIKGICGAYQDG